MSLNTKKLHEPATARSDSIHSSSQVQSEQHTRVLVVDDSVFVCNAVRRELRAAGVEAAATNSGYTALNLVRDGHYDVLLIDLMMPAMSGEELVRRLQQCVPALPCIILTGNATKERVLSLTREPNVAGIVTKPWDRERLIATINAAIAEVKQPENREPV